MPAPLKYPAPRVYTSVAVTGTVDTGAYATEWDVLTATAVITNASWKIDQPVTLVGLNVIDEDSEAPVNIHFFFLTATGSVGAANAAFAPTDAVLATVQGECTVWKEQFQTDLTANTHAFIQPNLSLIPSSGTRDIYFATAISGNVAAHQYTAATDLKFRFIFVS